MCVIEGPSKPFKIADSSLTLYYYCPRYSPKPDVASEPTRKSLPDTSTVSVKSVTVHRMFEPVEPKRLRSLNSSKTMLPTCCTQRPCTCKFLLFIEMCLFGFDIVGCHYDSCYFGTHDYIYSFSPSSLYRYRFPNMTDPDGNNRTIDNNPSVTVPHEFNHGYNGTLLEEEPIVYPPGYDSTFVTDEGGILYLSPEQAKLAWKVPLRPHIGTLAVMPNNTGNYLDEEAQGGANSIPPSRFGGNIDDWRIGKGGTMYFRVEVPGALLLVGDTHAAQGDSELAGTAMETSMTAKLRVTLHKADRLPKMVATVDWPLLETSDQFVVHGFAFANYLDELEDPSTIFTDGASLDQAMQDCFVKTRDWLMDVYDLLEEETIALMTTSIDFGITQVVDGNWGVHADIPKWVFDDSGAPFDYSCTTSQGPGRRRRELLNHDRDRRSLFNEIMVGDDDNDMDVYASQLYNKVTTNCEACADHHMRELLAEKFVHAKLDFVHSRRV